VPGTPNGKRREVPVKRIVAGMDPARAVSGDALRSPESITGFCDLAVQSRRHD
jgi:acetoacetyl-CoA synthetase